MMQRSVLSGQIGVLVDHLRETKDKRLEMADIASVTEVLIATMEAYFRSIDTKIYSEFRDLSDYIDNARTEIATLVPTDIKSSRLPRAGLELDAIVKSTEDATNGIMEAAEAIMAIGSDDMESYKAAVEAECMRIFEHCSFQDITGQRISKVVETLQHIENRIDALKDIWGVDQRDARVDAPKDDDSHLLRGPALDGEGIDQREVDELINSEAGQAQAVVAEAEPEAPVIEAEPAPQPAEKPQAPKVQAPEAPKAQAPKAETRPAPPPEVKTALEPEAEAASEEATQAEIDALFA
jgi:chemotaxis regulatin CheY-phosphate phosphatase CheZ